MELIIESGATKTDYCLTDTREVKMRFPGPGVNLATMDMDTVSLVIRDAVSRLSPCLDGPEAGGARSVEKVHFYAAGLSSGDRRPEKMLRELFPAASVECLSDLMAAARAVCGRRSGMALILGTGSNSCLYDGERIVCNIRPCGYVLGDFGSGAALGKRFLADYLQGLLPGALEEDFRREYGLCYDDVVASVYKGDAPARYLASFAPYVVSVYRGGDGGRELGPESRGYVRSVLEENFRLFFRRCVVPYGQKGCPAGVVGSFGCACRDVLEEVAALEGINIGCFLASPMDGLITYHLD